MTQNQPTLDQVQKEGEPTGLQRRLGNSGEERSTGIFQSAMYLLLRNQFTNLHMASLHWKKFKYTDLFASACKNILPPTVKKAKAAVD